MKPGFNFGRFYSALKKVVEHSGEDGNEYKRYIVSTYTSQRTDHVHEMDYKEYVAACEAMEAAAGTAYTEARRKARSGLLKQLQFAGIDTTDWNRVNAFCEDKRIAGKSFGKLTVDELKKVTLKIRSIQSKGGLKPKQVQKEVPTMATLIIQTNNNIIN